MTIFIRNLRRSGDGILTDGDGSVTRRGERLYEGMKVTVTRRRGEGWGGTVSGRRVDGRNRVQRLFLLRFSYSRE